MGEIEKKEVSLITQAADQVIHEKLWKHFPLDIIQTGSGTQTNMKIEADLTNYSNGSYTPIDLQLLDAGLGNDLTASEIIPKLIMVT